jgi:hypothetical protein
MLGLPFRGTLHEALAQLVQLAAKFPSRSVAAVVVRVSTCRFRWRREELRLHDRGHHPGGDQCWDAGR